jgi:hypothetical protein
MHKLVPAALPLGLLLPLAAHPDTPPQAAVLCPELGAHREGGPCQQGAPRQWKCVTHPWMSRRAIPHQFT